MKRYMSSLALGAIVAVAALVPLYGEIRSSALSHPEWARMLLRAIHTGEMIDASTQASQIFGILSWRESLSYRAERYYQADKIDVTPDGTASCVMGRGGPGEVSYRLGVVRAGRYRIRARLKGPALQPVEGRVANLEDATPLASFKVASTPTLSWVEAGQRRLQPGGYVATFLVPDDTCLTEIEIVPPCLQPIEPLGGWKPRAITQASDVAVTILRALELESELPPAAAALERSGLDFEIDESTGLPQAIPVAAGPEASWLRGGSGGTRAFLVLSIPSNGLYNVSVLGRFKTAQRWGLDSCYESVLCPSAETEGLRWRSVATLSLMAGRHFLAVDLAPESIVARVKIEEKKRSPDDYLATLKRLGFDAGVEGPVTRQIASDALDFLRSRARSMEGVGRCADAEMQLEVQGTLLAGNAVPPPALAPPQVNRGPGESGEGLPPFAPPGTNPGPPPPVPTPATTPGPPVVTTPLPPTPEPPTPTPPTPTPPTPTPPTPAPPTPVPLVPTPPTPTPPTPVPTPSCPSPPCP